MGALVGYGSSDEEDDVEQQQEVPKQAPVARQESIDKTTSKPTQESAPAPSSQTTTATTEAPMVGPVRQAAVPLGPSLPPPETQSLESVNDGPQADPATPQTPSSPYSANRALLHDLTLPTVPNLDIPPSPPGSPTDPNLGKKLDQFLALKKKGTHFNAKLEQSVALRNPSLTDKLLGFVDMGGGGGGGGSGSEDDGAALVDQYETTLPADLWDPRALPGWARRGALRKTGERLAKEREAERTGGTRSAVEFVTGTSSVGGDGGKAGLAMAARGEKRKADSR